MSRPVLTATFTTGNCPKYLNEKHIRPASTGSVLASDSLPLTQGALDLLAKADIFFVSSTDRGRDMDSNNRGGPPGFVRIERNGPDGVHLIWPEYSGNRLYQTLGNLTNTPLAGLTFPDFATGDVLYVTGAAEILTGHEAAAVLHRSKLAVRLTVTAARFVERGLMFRGDPGEPSPYNPPLRYLRKEQLAAEADMGSSVEAVLLHREMITPTIGRLRFRAQGVDKPRPWEAGQYVAMSLSDALDLGYQHMNDDDPRSVNDDYLRTFTISSPPRGVEASGAPSAYEFELTIRNVGLVTSFLLKDRTMPQQHIPLCGFGGSFFVRPAAEGAVVMVAGGIGITPLLAQLPLLDMARLRLLWTLRADDLALVSDTLHRHPGLGKSTDLFVTGGWSADSKERDGIVKDGATLHSRRIAEQDLKSTEESCAAATWYLCAGPALKKAVLSWLPGQNVVHEDFNY